MADEAPTHYQRLGVSPRASAATLREAYLRLARLLHPDQLSHASDAERRLAERRMREVNEAWAVLKDADRRAAYDARLKEQGRFRAPPPPRAPRAATFDAPGTAAAVDEDEDEDDDEIDDGVHLPFVLGKLPWLLLALVAAVIFVFTAYAKTPTDGPGTSAPGATSCVEPAPPGSC